MNNEPTFVIYSLSEASASDDDAGWWSNDDGWTTVDLATRFTAKEKQGHGPPFSFGNDAAWCPTPDPALV